MHEHLELDRRGRAIGADLVDRELAWHDDAREAERLEQRYRERARCGHLGRRVDLERGTDPARDESDRGVLDDDRIDAGSRDAPDQLLDRRELGLEHERVERDVEPRARAMDPAHDLGEAGRREVVGASPRVEPVIESEVHGVGAGGECGREGIAIASGRQNLGAAHRQRNLSGSVP